MKTFRLKVRVHIPTLAGSDEPGPKIGGVASTRAQFV